MSYLLRVPSQIPIGLGIPQISSHLRNIRILKNIPPSNLGNFGNSSNAWEARNFPNYMGICEIPKFLFSSKVLHVSSLISIKRLFNKLLNNLKNRVLYFFQF